MSLTTTIGTGALIGGFAAFAVYAATAPSDESAAALPAVPTFAPVPTPTVTQLAEGCEPPAVLTGSECVLTRPGPTVVVTVPAPGSRTSGRVAPAASDDGRERADEESDEESDEVSDDDESSEGRDDEADDSEDDD